MGWIILLNSVCLSFNESGTSNFFKIKERRWDFFDYNYCRHCNCKFCLLLRGDRIDYLNFLFIRVPIKPFLFKIQRKKDRSQMFSDVILDMQLNWAQCTGRKNVLIKIVRMFECIAFCTVNTFRVSKLQSKP